MRERGMTLVETVVAAAIAMLMAAALFGAAQSFRPAAAAAAALGLDAMVAQARALAAASGNGATIVVLPASPGFEARLYAGRPDAPGALAPAAQPAVLERAGIAEAVLGAPPFSLFFDAAGRASAAAGAAGGSIPLPADPGCPAGENAVTLRLSDGRATLLRQLPCKPVP